MNSTEYRVISGDTLSSIARRHNVTVDALSRLNGISDVNRIWAGQVLRIPRESQPIPPRPAPLPTYRVRAGDTLSAIAQRHNVTVEALSRANGLSTPESAKMGMVLTIPKETQPTPPKPSSIADSRKTKFPLRNQLVEQELIAVDDLFWRGAKALAVPHLLHSHLFKASMKSCFGDDIPGEAGEALFRALKSGGFRGPKYQFSKNLSEDTVAYYAKGVMTLSEPLIRQAQADPEKRFTLFLGMVHEFGHHLDFMLRHEYSTIGGSAPGEEGQRFTAEFVRFNDSLEADFDFATFHWGAKPREGGKAEIAKSTVYSVKNGEIDREARAKHLLFVVDELADQGEVIINGEKVTVDFFKIRGEGAVHEDITKSAASIARVTYDSRLDEGCAWPDIPCAGNGVETCYYKTWREYETPGTLSYRSHYGDLQFWHSMAPAGRWTNQQVLDKIIEQAKAWYEQGVRASQLFHIGKILHMVQDSYSRSHVIRVEADAPATRADALKRKVKTGDTLESIAAEYGLTWRQLAEFNWGSSVPTVINVSLYKEVGCRKPRRPNDPVDPNTNYYFSDDDVKSGTGVVLIPRALLRNQIISFQSYADQDSKKHGEADKITGKSWRDIPGAVDARDASAEILKMFAGRSQSSELEAYLRTVVYPLAPGAAEAIAGGSAPRFTK